MKSLRQVLTECTEAQLEQIARLWGLGDAPNKGWSHHRTRLEQGMRDAIAARFVWEHLGEDERVVLYNVLGPSARNWVVRDDLPKKVQLPAARYIAALDRVKRRLLVFEVLAKVQGNQLVDHRLGFYAYGYERKLPVQAVDILYTPVEIANFLYATGREYFAPQSDRSKLTLEKILTPLYQSDLDEMGHRYGMELDGGYYTRADYRSMLATSVVQPEAVAYALQQLDPPTRNLFTLLYERGGKLSVQSIREFKWDDPGLLRTQANPSPGPMISRSAAAAPDHHTDDATLTIMLHTLAQYAIAFDTFSEREHLVFVPYDIYKNLKEAPAHPSGPKSLVSTASPPAAVRPGETIILYDLATVIGVIYQQDIEPTKAGTVPKRIAAKIDPLLRGCPRTSLSMISRSAAAAPDHQTYLEMLFDIAQELGLIQLSRPSARDIKQHYEPGPVLEQWSHLDAVEQTRRLLQLWVSSGRWSDVVGANFVDWYSDYVDPKAVRSSIISGMIRSCCGTPANPSQDLESDDTEREAAQYHQRDQSLIRMGAAAAHSNQTQTWYTVASLVDIMRGRDPFVLRPRQRGIPSLGYSKAGELRKHWDTCDREIIIGSLSSSLSELGIVALGYQQPEFDDPDLCGVGLIKASSPGISLGAKQPRIIPLMNPDFFTLTDLGAAVLSSEVRPVSTPPPSPAHNGNRSLVVQPNFELLLLQPDLPILYRLLPFAQVNQIGMVSRLTLTRESLLRAAAASMRVEEILQLLEEHSQKGMPQNVAYTLHDWAKLYKGATISQIVLLEVTSEAVANEICSSPKMKELVQDFGLRRLGPCAIALNSDINLPELRRMLDKMGIVSLMIPTCCGSRANQSK